MNLLLLWVPFVSVFGFVFLILVLWSSTNSAKALILLLFGIEFVVLFRLLLLE